MKSDSIQKKTYRERIYKSYKEDLDTRQASSDYSKIRKLTQKYIMRNYYKFLPKEKDITILDLGCGLGHYIYSLKKLGYENVKGVDASESNVLFCKNEGLDVSKDDAVHFLSENPSSFDVIIFNDVIEHFTKDEMMEVLDLIYMSLKKYGCVITKTVNVANPFTGISGRYIDFTHEIGFVDLSLAQVFKAADFEDIKVFGSDIYVFGGPIGILIKIISKFVYFVFYLFNCMAGRFSIKIFEKTIVCVAYKR